MTEASDPTQAGTAVYDAEGTLCLSRNEIESLCAKAARGAGLPWGVAEEAGFAGGWLAARGVDGAMALLAHLTGSAARDWSEMCPVMERDIWRTCGDGPLCPIAVGTALSDAAAPLADTIRGQGLRIDRVAQPLLVLPFLHHVARDLEHPVGLSWRSGAVQVDQAGRFCGDWAALARMPDVSATLALAGLGTAHDPTPLVCAPETIAALNAFALRTTVPPSDKSRADAGAGDTDND